MSSWNGWQLMALMNTVHSLYAERLTVCVVLHQRPRTLCLVLCLKPLQACSVRDSLKRQSNCARALQAHLDCTPARCKPLYTTQQPVSQIWARATLPCGCNYNTRLRVLISIASLFLLWPIQRPTFVMR